MQTLLKSYEGKTDTIKVVLKHGETVRGEVIKVDNGMVNMKTGASHAPEKVYFLVEQIGSIKI